LTDKRDLDTAICIKENDLNTAVSSAKNNKHAVSKLTDKRDLNTAICIKENDLNTAVCILNIDSNTAYCMLIIFRARYALQIAGRIM